MSTPTVLNRRSSIRASSGTTRGTPSRATRSFSSLNIEVQYLSPTEQSERRGLDSLQEEQSREQELEQQEAGRIVSLEQEQELRTRLLEDQFTRAYQPSFDSSDTNNSAFATSNARNISSISNSGSSKNNSRSGPQNRNQHSIHHIEYGHQQQQQQQQQQTITRVQQRARHQLPRPFQQRHQELSISRPRYSDHSGQTFGGSSSDTDSQDASNSLELHDDKDNIDDSDDLFDSDSEEDSEGYYLEHWGYARPCEQPYQIQPAAHYPHSPLGHSPPTVGAGAGSKPRTPTSAQPPAARPRTPVLAPAPVSRPRTPANGAGYPSSRSRTPVSLDSDGQPVSYEPLKHYTPEIETQETLRRERTRIMERTIVSSYRHIAYKDITNIQPLKKGGFGEIHTAEWSRLRVVLKRALVEHSEGVEQFDQELEILKRVHDYDFIVPFYGVTTDPRTKVKCMVMKHCVNGNLCTFLEKNHTILTWSERYRLSIEITKGLEFLHKSGFHHRDLHSGNILLDDKRTAMICDFGLSRSSTKARTNDIVAAVGVASFLAPERFPTERPIYSAACDIYSLGVIFWHISSGRIPFGKRLRDPALLKELMDGHREQIVPGTPQEYRDLLVKCWDVNPAKRLQIDVVIAILQTLMAKPTEPMHQVATGFTAPSIGTSAALPVPPELGAKMANLERASNTLNTMVFDIKEPAMRETVNYIERTRAFFRDQPMPPEPYSHLNPPKTPIYLCPLVGDIAALSYYLSNSGSYNPINESSEQTGDTALHLACLFLESPMDTIKILVELGADINLENLQGYTPVMILVSSNTQYCYEALKYFVMRGARIPAYIRNPITPLNSAQIYALNLVNESRQIHLNDPAASAAGVGAGLQNNGGMTMATTQERVRSRNRVISQNQNVFQERNGRKVDRLFAQGRPLIHVVAAMQEDYRILDCLCEAGLDPAMSFGGETALAAAAAHLRIKNVEWLLNHDLDISTEAGINRAIKVVKTLHASKLSSLGDISPVNSHHNTPSSSGNSNGKLASPSSGKGDISDYLENIMGLGKYSWAGVAYGDEDGMSRDMVGPILQLLEQWTGSRRISARKEVATKLKLMYGSAQSEDGGHHPMASTVATTTSAYSNGSSASQGNGQQQSPRHNYSKKSSTVYGPTIPRSLRKNQRHLIDQVLNERPSIRFW
ncbi:hypothetical protein BGZ50_004635 [Haplosporangium sp. Z 11]|nr:hypothetical protein BGZ50_004635 [Haplosporangium sp. Z 11]